MALQMQDIFPLNSSQGAANTARILEPTNCQPLYTDPTEAVQAEVRLIYTKKLSHPYYMFQYAYKSLMYWEFELIENFYKRMNGKYEVFYAVDWNARYRISAAVSSPGSITLDRVTGLENEAGFGGNTLLIYSPNRRTINKQILTIAAAEDFSDTTISVNETVTTAIALNAEAYAYILYPCMFESSVLQPTIVDFCIQKDVVYYYGYGNKLLYGSIIDINIPIVQVGVMK